MKKIRMASFFVLGLTIVLLNGCGGGASNQGEIDSVQKVPDIAGLSAEKAGTGVPDIALEEAEPEPQDKPPSVGLQTTDGEMVSCTFATMGTYSWSYEGQSVTACGAAPTEWKEIATIELDKTDGTIELCFSPDMVEYSVSYWIENATCGVADPVPMEGDTILLEDETAKGIYELHVVYGNGEAYYGFKIE